MNKTKNPFSKLNKTTFLNMRGFILPMLLFGLAFGTFLPFVLFFFLPFCIAFLPFCVFSLPFFIFSIIVIVILIINYQKTERVARYHSLNPEVKQEINAIHGKKEVRILSIDGGGIRGIIPTVILREIERKTGKHIHELFDLVAGTSIGGIIAISLTTPDNEGKPLINTDKMLEIFVNNGKDIFKCEFKDKVKNLGGLIDEAYSCSGLVNILKTHLKNIPLSRTLVPIMVTAFELRRYIPYNLKSWDSLNDFERWFAGRATSAAPTYFELADGTNLQVNPFSFIDGGVILNNPSMAAYAEAKLLFPDATDFSMLSIGTGERHEDVNPEVAKDWGVAWIRPLINIMFDGSSRAIDIQMSEILPKGSYIRLQPELPKNLMAMDNVSAENIKNLVAHAENFVVENSHKIEKICKALRIPVFFGENKEKLENIFKAFLQRH